MIVHAFILIVIFQTEKVCWQVESQVSMIPQACRTPADAVETPSSAFACTTIARPKMFAAFPSRKLIIESVIDMVVMPVELVETMLPRSPTCLVDEVGNP